MTPFLIVLALLTLAVGIVLWATRRTPDRPAQRPSTPGAAADDPSPPAQPASADPFASAPPRTEPHP